MGRIVVLSSYVAAGEVGLRAAQPVLQRLGHEIIGLPTVLLSNHAGMRHVGGGSVSIEQLRGMLRALKDNGLIASVNAILIGYLPTASHVHFAVELVQYVREAAGNIPVICDPVLGDDPSGLYVDVEAAQAIRDKLLGPADYLTPNRFELAWLSNCTVVDPNSVVKAAQSLKCANVVATSVPLTGRSELGTMLVADGQASMCCVSRLTHAPKGTGDFLAAHFAGLLLNGLTAQEAIAGAIGGLHRALQEAERVQSSGLVKQIDKMIGAPPAAIEPVEVPS